MRIITADIDRLVVFYESVLNTAADRQIPVFAEFRTSVGTLAIGARETRARFRSDEVALQGANRSAIIERQVDDVDAEYERSKDQLGDALVQAPTTMPSGNRSFLFRDPDAGLVNLFTPATPDAIAKFKRWSHCVSPCGAAISSRSQGLGWTAKLGCSLIGISDNPPDRGRRRHSPR